MNPLHVLIVEDEGIVAMEIKSYVVSLGYEVVSICSHAIDAISAVSRYKVDIVLMDICLKGERDGIETAHEIRQRYPNIQTIFLTAHMDDYNVDRAIELDPVAYLSKPFNREELRVFLKIATQKLQHSQKKIVPANNHYIELDHEFSYDESERRLFYCQEHIHLTHKERELLDLLIKRKNQIVDLYTIENYIWPDKTVNANTIRTLVKRIREKLGYRFIETTPLSGYRIVISP